jgi:hypothetical protein
VWRRAVNGKRKAWNMTDANALIAYWNTQHFPNRGGEVVGVAKEGVAGFVGGNVPNVAENQGE